MVRKYKKQAKRTRPNKKSRLSEWRDAEVRRLWEVEGESIGEIGRRLGITRQAVSLRIIRSGYLRAERPRPELPYETLYDLYYVKGLSMNKISTILGVSIDLVRSELLRHGIGLTRQTLRGKYRRENLYQLYIAEQRSQRDIVRSLRLGVEELRDALKHWGFEIRAYRRQSRVDAEAARRLYADEGLRIEEICRKLRCSHHTLYNALDRIGVPRRGGGRRRLRKPAAEKH